MDIENSDKVHISEEVEKLFQNAQKNRLVHKWSDFVNNQRNFWKVFSDNTNEGDIVEFLGKQILNEFWKDYFNFLNEFRWIRFWNC